MNKEIELKCEISDIPQLKEMEDIEIYKISQNYLYQDKFSSIRVRSIFNPKCNKTEYVYTVKTKGNIQDNYSLYEIESNITEQEYEQMQELSNYVIEKYRIKIPLNNKLMAELDLYNGKLEGLLTVEVEFPNKEELKKFSKPNWFGENLDKKIFSNANLSKMTREQFLNMIDRESYEKNVCIRKEIEKLIKNLL